MTDKTFTVAGTSVKNGVTKVRFANDTGRVKVLDADGQTDIVLVELGGEFTKIDAANFIKDLPEFQNPEQQAAIVQFIEKETAAVTKVKKPRKTVEAVVEQEEVAEVVAVDETEDAPF